MGVTGFITRIIGFFYRIFLSNALGARLLGIYQLIFPVYGVPLLFLSVSRICGRRTIRYPAYRGSMQ